MKVPRGLRPPSGRGQGVLTPTWFTYAFQSRTPRAFQKANVKTRCTGVCVCTVALATFFFVKFEGEDVDGFLITVKGFKGPIGIPLSMGERLELTCVVEVIEVSHRENRSSGQIFRDHAVRIVEVE